MNTASSAQSLQNVPILETEPLHMRAGRYLREMIIDGRLRPWAPIDEKSMCDQFGTSRTPLREALKVLAAEGLIELLPRRGAVVAGISVKDLREKFAIVRVLEAHAASTICESASPEQLQALEAIHRQVIAAHKKRNGKLYFELNEKFHREVVAATGNKTLIDLHLSLVGHLRRARFTVMSAHSMAPEFVEDHQRIMQAIAARKAGVAAKEFIKHQTAVERETIAYFESGEASRALVKGTPGK
jgi:DNA-binding GntR family transcriptional regulator